MKNIDILKRYQEQQRQLSRLFSWLDENDMTLKELTKDDLELYFKLSKNTRGTNKLIKTNLRQVLQGEGISDRWVQTAIVPYPPLYMSLVDVLTTVNDYAKGVGAEKYKTEIDGFDSVKASIILLWIGFSAQEAGYVLKDDVNKTQIQYKGNEYLLIDSIGDFIERYKKSTGYFAGKRPNVKFRLYKDEDYFIRSTRTASRDKIVKRLFEKVSDLDIDVNSIQKAGLFDRAYLGNEELITDNLSLEYQEYKKKRLGLE